MAEAEYWRFTVARDCQKKNTSENHSECRLRALTVTHPLAQPQPIIMEAAAVASMMIQLGTACGVAVAPVACSMWRGCGDWARARPSYPALV
jgi:hypothetical protein